MTEYQKVMQHLKDSCKEITSQWNGDEPGIKEERASTAGELLELLDQVDKITKELDI